MKRLIIVAFLLISANLMFSFDTTIIPADALLRVEVKVKALVESAYYKEFKTTPQGKETLEKFQKVKDLIGIDPEKSVNSVEFYAAKPKNVQDKQILFNISTNLENSRLKALISAEAAKKGSKIEEMEIQGIQALKVTPTNKDVGFILFLAPGQLAVTTEAWLNDVATNFKGKKIVNTKLSKTDAASDKMMINAALIVPEEAKQQMALKPPAYPFSKVDMLYLGLDSQNKGFEANVVLQCLNAEDASTISNGLNGFVMMGRMFLQQKNIAEILDYLKIKLDKNDVTLNLKMDETQLKALAEKLKTLAPPGMVPMPQPVPTPETTEDPVAPGSDM